MSDNKLYKQNLKKDVYNKRRELVKKLKQIDFDISLLQQSKQVLLDELNKNGEILAQLVDN